MKPYTFEQRRRRVQRRPGRLRQGAQLHADAVRPRHDGARRRRRSSSARRASVHGREHPEPLLTASRLTVGRHRHGELSRGADDGRRPTSRPTCSSTTSGGSPAACAGRTSSRSRCRSTRCSTTSTVGQCALVPCDAAALERIVFDEDDVYPALSRDAHLARRLGRGLPDPPRLERNGRAARSARDLGLELHRSADRDAHPRQPGARDLGDRATSTCAPSGSSRTATTSRCRCSTRTSRTRSRPCKAPAPTTTSR